MFLFPNTKKLTQTYIPLLLNLRKCNRRVGASLVAQLVKNPPPMQETGSIPGSWSSPGEGIGYPLQYSWASLMAQTVKNLPAMEETWFWFLGWEDPLEEGMATHSSILAWRIPWTEEPGRLQSMGSQRIRHDWATNHTAKQNSRKFLHHYHVTNRK